jgi:hypothetical protein
MNTVEHETLVPFRIVLFKNVLLKKVPLKKVPLKKTARLKEVLFRASPAQTTDDVRMEVFKVCVAHGFALAYSAAAASSAFCLLRAALLAKTEETQMNAKSRKERRSIWQVIM